MCHSRSVLQNGFVLLWHKRYRILKCRNLCVVNHCLYTSPFSPQAPHIAFVTHRCINISHAVHPYDFMFAFQPSMCMMLCKDINITWHYMFQRVKINKVVCVAYSCIAFKARSHQQLEEVAHPFATRDQKLSEGDHCSHRQVPSASCDLLRISLPRKISISVYRGPVLARLIVQQFYNCGQAIEKSSRKISLKWLLFKKKATICDRRQSPM